MSNVVDTDTWKVEALRAVKTVARRNKPFIADDVWAYLEKKGTPAPADPRALGPVLLRAVKAGVVYNTGTYAPSARRHASPVVVWEKA